MTESPSQPPLETSRGAHFAALAAAMLFPTVSTWMYFLALSESAVVQPVYSMCKLLQFAFPLVWVWFVQRRRIHFRWPQRGDALAGLIVGCLMAAAGIVAYLLLFRDSGWLAHAPELIREKLGHLGISSRVAYWSFALFVSVPHAGLEEYYWRWFCFGQLRRVVPQGTAVGIASLAFMAHHVLVLHRLLAAGWQPTMSFSLCVAFGGAIWCWMYARRGTIYASWISHLLVDAGIMWIGSDLTWG